MLFLRRCLAYALGLGILAGLSQVPWGATPEGSLLRLSWRSNGEEIRIPRLQNANLPEHMRLPEGQAYDVRIRPYELRVLLDGREVLRQRVESPGYRHDRPLSVFQEFVVAPGQHALEVQFVPQAVAGAAPPSRGTPYRTQLTFQPGQVVLITQDSQGAWSPPPD